MKRLMVDSISRGPHVVTKVAFLFAFKRNSSLKDDVLNEFR